MPFILNRTSVASIDVSSIPYNNLPTPPNLVPAIHYSRFTTIMPYPLLIIQDNVIPDYGFIYGNTKGLYNPAIDNSNTAGTNVSRPSFMNDPIQTMIRSSTNNTATLFNFEFQPFGNLAVGPPLVFGHVIPAAPIGIIATLTTYSSFADLPFTVDGNGELVNSTTGKQYFINTTDLTWYQAFPLIDLDSSVWTSSTQADIPNNLNTTFIEKDSGIAPAVYASRWKQSAIGGAAVATTDYIQLSDPADDLIYQNAVNYDISSLKFYNRGNSQEWFFTCLQIIAGNLIATCFIFSNDLTTYRRVDITQLTPSGYDDVLYFKDLDGFQYFIDEAGYAAISTVTIQGRISLGDVFSLGCWSPCANLAHRFIGEDLPNA